MSRLAARIPDDGAGSSRVELSGKKAGTADRRRTLKVGPPSPFQAYPGPPDPFT